MDTLPQGSHFNGLYGVITELKAHAALHDAGGKPGGPTDVVAWTSEDGDCFAPGCMDSMISSGFKQVEDFPSVLDLECVRFADALGR